jgi:hypothetical protein
VFIGAPLAENGSGSATLFSGENGAILFRAVGDDNTSRLGTSLSSSGSLNRYGFVDLLALSSSATLGSMISRYSFMEGIDLPKGNSISASNPTRVQINVDMPREMSGQVYRILATNTGTTIWLTPQGIQIPLADSSILRRSITNSLPPFFRRDLGYLDFVGNAIATIDFPSGHLSNLVGTSLHFCAIVYDANGYIEASTVAKELQVVF